MQLRDTKKSQEDTTHTFVQKCSFFVGFQGEIPFQDEKGERKAIPKAKKSRKKERERERSALLQFMGRKGGRRRKKEM